MMRTSIQWTAYAAVCLAMAVAFQSLRLGQAFTGPAVNAVLMTAAGFLGPVAGAVIGLFTPLFALVLGQLKPVLAPAIPFIMIANALMAVTFWYLLRHSRVLAVIAAAAVKYIALALPVQYLLQLPAPMSLALSWPQLLTALAGGTLALAVLAALPVGVPRHLRAPAR